MLAVSVRASVASFLFFFFNDTATTEIYTLSLHDALPISRHSTSHSIFRVPMPLSFRSICHRDFGRFSAAPIRTPESTPAGHHRPDRSRSPRSPGRLSPVVLYFLRPVPIDRPRHERTSKRQPPDSAPE